MDRREAEEGLTAIAAARRQAGELRAYRQTGSIFIAWGLVWLAGFAALQFFPEAAMVIWSLGWFGALAWTITRPRHAEDINASASWLVAVALVGLILVVTGADMRAAGMVSGLVLAAAATLLGIWVGRRYLVLSVMVLLAASIGWWFWPEQLYLMLALGGGGSLAAGGLWLRRP